MLGQMWRLNAAAGLAAGQTGVNWAAEQARKRASSTTRGPNDAAGVSPGRGGCCPRLPCQLCRSGGPRLIERRSAGRKNPGSGRAQDAEAALDLLTEMQRVGPGSLPEGIGTPARGDRPARGDHRLALQGGRAAGLHHGGEDEGPEGGDMRLPLRRLQLRYVHVGDPGQAGCRPRQR